MKKLIVTILAVMLIISVLPSCKNKKKPLEISEEEAFKVVSTLVPLSHEFNVIFFGEGLPTHDNADYDKTTYVEVDLTRSRYSSVAGIKFGVETVYSKKYLDSVYVNMFIGSSSKEEDGLLDNNVSPRYKEIDGKLMVDASYPALEIMGRLEVISTEIVKKAPEYVLVKGICRDENGNELEKNFYITLQNGTWLLDGPTY